VSQKTLLRYQGKFKEAEVLSTSVTWELNEYVLLHKSEKSSLVRNLAKSLVVEVYNQLSHLILNLIITVQLDQNSIDSLSFISTYCLSIQSKYIQSSTNCGQLDHPQSTIVQLL
jgi:hypothetical protein